MMDRGLRGFPGLSERMQPPGQGGLNRMVKSSDNLVEASLMIDRRRNRLPDPEVRAEFIARIRREIRQGTYDTPEKLELALQLLFDEHGLIDREDEEASSPPADDGLPRRW